MQKTKLESTVNIAIVNNTKWGRRELDNLRNLKQKQLETGETS